MTPTEAPKPCTPFSVTVAVLTPDDKREVHFGLTHGCNPDNTDFWTIDFILKVLRSGEMKTRVEVHVTVGESKKAQAAALAENKELTPAKVSLLKNQIADRATEVPKSEASTDPQLNSMLLKLL
jgi:hypothetical protein